MKNFEVVVDLHYKNLYYFALNLTRNGADAEDLVQQAFLKLAKSYASIRDMTKVKSWLFSTLYRLFIDQKRKFSRHPEIQYEETSSDALIAEPSRIGQHVDSATVVTALKSLKESLRVPLTLYYFEQYSYQEIADVMELPVGTVMSRLYRGKAELYNQLKDPQPQAKNGNI
ncbi:MAG: RNA polymerase sigma factor [Verrucomicrobia bacterium]|nr:RNA polymerase sigma factor [Verrucomicrobiota bacterium]MDA1065434.1 RNA polymerase sigma factor [Verrucomicrobiota bacterium]